MFTGVAFLNDNPPSGIVPATTTLALHPLLHPHPSIHKCRTPNTYTSSSYCILSMASPP